MFIKPIVSTYILNIKNWFKIALTIKNILDITTEQHLHYLPVPTIDSAECNSTTHYNGLIQEEHICAGFTDADKSPCYVSFI